MSMIGFGNFKLLSCSILLGIAFGACAFCVADESQSGDGWYCEKDVACGQYQSENPTCIATNQGTGRCKGESLNSKTSACKPSFDPKTKCKFVDFSKNYISCDGKCVDDPMGTQCTLKVPECKNPQPPQVDPTQ